MDPERRAEQLTPVPIRNHMRSPQHQGQPLSRAGDVCVISAAKAAAIGMRPWIASASTPSDAAFRRFGGPD
jgi:hypothetical protein